MIISIKFTFIIFIFFLIKSIIKFAFKIFKKNAYYIFNKKSLKIPITIKLLLVQNNMIENFFLIFIFIL
jgi:hypothetical protein